MATLDDGVEPAHVPGCFKMSNTMVNWDAAGNIRVSTVIKRAR